jgi:hypothetical protein
LATAEQAQRLQDVIGEALCDAPAEHPGPCRVAWPMMSVGGDDEALDGSYGLDAETAAFIGEQLTQGAAKTSTRSK